MRFGRVDTMKICDTRDQNVKMKKRRSLSLRRIQNTESNTTLPSINIEKNQPQDNNYLFEDDKARKSITLNSPLTSSETFLITAAATAATTTATTAATATTTTTTSSKRLLASSLSLSSSGPSTTTLLSSSSDSNRITSLSLLSTKTPLSSSFSSSSLSSSKVTLSKESLEYFIVDGPHKETSGILYSTSSPCFIGRRSRCHENGIHLGKDLLVSGNHGEIQFLENGVFQVRDHASANGTYLNGTRLVPHEPRTFQLKDSIVVGSSVISFMDKRRKVICKQKPEENVRNGCRLQEKEDLDLALAISKSLLPCPRNKTFHQDNHQQIIQELYEIDEIVTSLLTRRQELQQSLSLSFKSKKQHMISTLFPMEEELKNGNSNTEKDDDLTTTFSSSKPYWKMASLSSSFSNCIYINKTFTNFLLTSLGHYWIAIAPIQLRDDFPQWKENILFLLQQDKDDLQEALKNIKAYQQDQEEECNEISLKFFETLISYLV